ncbi:hypothetical protein F4677DRAFT_425893 [Hypoxylon crocopeplum]|nr:hypothetical protein F4677DRAFT_425893 [Hypoxylon crocopeplum]
MRNFHGINATGRKRNQYDAWALKYDSSISPDRKLYKFFSVEITSPAERALPAAFYAVHYALNLLNSRYRTSVNSSCGMHVHVGDGVEPMPIEHLRRVMGLFFAADPLLACLHPPERRLNYYSASIRERSRMAHQEDLWGNDDPDEHYSANACCQRYIGAGMRFGESPISWREKNHPLKHVVAFEQTREPGHFEPFYIEQDGDKTEKPKENEWDGPAFQTSDLPLKSDEDLEIDSRIKRHLKNVDGNNTTGISAPYVSTQKRTHRFLYPEFVTEDIETSRAFGMMGKVDSDPGVFVGVDTIFGSGSACNLDWLVGNLSRPNYNISAYKCWFQELRGTTPPTIEFREAAGTTSGLWAEIWARICVGLTHFAIHAPVDEYLSALHNIDQGREEKTPYDLLDLLDQAGLFAEARYVEQRLKNHMREWGFKYYGATDAK